jgi:hypothetical protein
LRDDLTMQIAVGAECGVDRAIAGAAHNLARFQFTGGGGAGRYRELRHS